MTEPQASPLNRLDPELAIRPGPNDSRLVLGLWCLRKAAWPTIWLGFSVAILAYGDIDAFGDSLAILEDPGSMLGAALSPLGVVVAGLVIRIGANLLALAAAWPLTMRTRKHHYEDGNRVTRPFNLWRDRLYQARAYRSLRYTWGVRRAAYKRLGESGDVFRICEFVLAWANVVLLIAIPVVIGYTAPAIQS